MGEPSLYYIQPIRFVRFLGEVPATWRDEMHNVKMNETPAKVSFALHCSSFNVKKMLLSFYKTAAFLPISLTAAKLRVTSSREAICCTFFLVSSN